MQIIKFVKFRLPNEVIILLCFCVLQKLINHLKKYLVSYMTFQGIRASAFHNFVRITGKACKILIQNGCSSNFIASLIVKFLELTPKPHASPYKTPFSDGCFRGILKVKRYPLSLLIMLNLLIMTLHRQRVLKCFFFAKGCSCYSLLIMTLYRQYIHIVITR